MKRWLSLLLALSLTACGSTSAPASGSSGEEGGETVELIVFAAASMQETLEEIAEDYKAVAPNVTLIYSFESSGTLLDNIEAGADCDLFISAAPTQMNALDGTMADDAEKNPDGQDLLLEGTRVDLLENKVALAVPEGNPKNIESFDHPHGDPVERIHRIHAPHDVQIGRRRCLHRLIPAGKENTGILERESLRSAVLWFQ